MSVRSGRFLIPAGALALAVALAAPAAAPARRAADDARDALEQAAAGSLCGPAAGTVDAAAKAAPLLRTDLGRLHYPIGTAVDGAQRWFDQGLRLAYAFNHPQALRAFREAQRLDPDCAMCAWGEALVLGPNINAAMPEAQRAPALAAARRAQMLAAAQPSLRPVERALVDAMARRYDDAPRASRAGLDRAYADAMRAVVARFPQDPQAPVLQAEALMLLSPWSYWSADGSRPRASAAEAVAALERVLRRDPDHPGAIHYYIHAVEGSVHAGRAAPYAERLAALMPGAAHLVHMPAHIYYRIGRYQDAVDANREATRLDERHAASPADRPMFLRGYYLHNLHFLIAAAVMAGDAQSALQAADRVVEQAGADARGAQSVRAAVYLAYARLASPESTLALPDPGEAEPYVRAAWHHARGMALAAQQRLDEAQAEAAALGALHDRADLSALETAGIPARQVLAIARDALRARLAVARGDFEAAARTLRAAVAVQDRLPYMEPPWWPHPLRQSLGAALALAGRLDEAERTLRDSLARTPHDGWVLYGLREVLVRRGEADEARAVDRQLGAAWAGPAGALRLDRL